MILNIFLGFYIVLYETKQNKAALQIALLFTVATNVKLVIEYVITFGTERDAIFNILKFYILK